MLSSVSNITIKNYRRFSSVKISLSGDMTAFVGVNNSGKSSVLRFFVEFRQLFAQLGDGVALAHCMTRSVVGFHVFNVADREEVFSRSTDRDIEIGFDFTPYEVPGVPSDLMPMQAVLTVPRRRETPLTLDLTLANGKHIPPEQAPDGAGRLYSADGSFLNYSTHGAVAYLDGLTTLFRELSRTTYVGPFRHALNLEAADNYVDISVGRAFVRQWKGLKGGSTRKKVQTALRITETMQRLFGIDRLEINALPDDTALQLIVDSESFRLDEMGSGMAQFLMTLTALAIGESTLNLIDEPELGLHPSLQLELLSAIASVTSGKVLFATHNLSLARSAADRIYCVHKEPGWTSTLEPFDTTSRLSELLGEMHFRGYRDLGYRKLLLVEGPTELRTISQFLRKLGKDHQIALLSMNGSNAINASRDVAHQLEEIKRIIPDVAVLIDSEKSSESAQLAKDRAGFVQSCTKAKVACHVLHRRAIENYFSARAISAVTGQTCQMLEPFQASTEAKHPWGKARNWRIAEEMHVEELQGTDLYTFLAEL